VNQLSANPLAWESVTPNRVNALWRLVQKRRAKLESTLPAHHIDVFGFPRPMFECLARNEVLCIAFDGGGGRRFTPVTLCDRPAHIPLAPWRLAQKTGATVVPAVVLQPMNGKTSHQVVLGPGFTVDQPAEAAQKFTRWFSAWVARYPDHYESFLRLRESMRLHDTKPLFDDRL
jgi:KDO2-lipid IV(A) lauroyltransferase